MQGWERAINNISDPSPTIPTDSMKQEKGKTGGKKGVSTLANEKALALLLKPASPTQLNAGSPRSFHRDTKRNKSPAVLQGSAARSVPRVTSTGSCGTGRAQ